MWIELIKNYCNSCEFSIPTDNKDIETIEKELKILLHDDLKAVLMESNGILGEYGLGLLWTADKIKSDNKNFRTHEDFKGLYIR